jgi:hypothetical protein
LKVTHDEETNEVSVDVCDDPYQYGALDVSNLPLLITVGQVNELNTKTKDTNFISRSVEFILLIQQLKKIPLL